MDARSDNIKRPEERNSILSKDGAGKIMAERIEQEENPLSIQSKIEYLNGLAVKNNESRYLISEKEEKQILDDHEKVNQLTASELKDLPLLKVAGEQALEIKQLKAKIENIENANEMWKERATGFVELVNEKADLMIENDNLKQKLEKIKKYNDKFIILLDHPINLKLKKILEEK